MRTDWKYTFTLEWTLTLQVLNRLTEGERERERKNIFLPYKVSKTQPFENEVFVDGKKDKGPVIGEE